jgi:hypothetical protein
VSFGVLLSLSDQWVSWGAGSNGLVGSKLHRQPQTIEISKISDKTGTTNLATIDI